MPRFLRRIMPVLGSIFTQIGILTLLFWAYHMFAAYAIKTLKIKLGIVIAETAPLYANPRVSLTWWVIPAVVTLLAYLVIFRIFFEKRKITVPNIFLICMMCFVLINITVAMIGGGLGALERPYLRGDLEYYGDVPKVEGVKAFLRDHTEMLPELSMHSKTKPPGGVLFLWLVAKLFGKGGLVAACMTIVFTSLSIIPLYLLARILYGEGVARYAVGFFLIAPNMVMFTATAMDGPFSVFPILSMYFFFKAMQGNAYKVTLVYSVLTGIALSMAMFMNYTAAIIGVFFLVITAITFFAKKEYTRGSLITLLITSLTFALFYFILYVWSGFNLFDAVISSYRWNKKCIGTGYGDFKQYFNISIANLFAFLIGTGIPMTALWFREIINAFRRLIRRSEADVYILAGLMILLITSFSTLFTLEVERIWLFMVPFIVIPAAKHLNEYHRPWKFYAIAGLLCVQLLLSEIFLDTYW